MIPIYFKQANRRLQKQPPNGAEALFPEFTHNDGVTQTACYRLTLQERISALIFGRVWMSIKIGNSACPAVMLKATRTPFKPVRVHAPMVAKEGCRHCHGTGSTGIDTITGQVQVCSCVKEKAVVEATGHIVK